MIPFSEPEAVSAGLAILIAFGLTGFCFLLAMLLHRLVSGERLFGRSSRWYYKKAEAISRRPCRTMLEFDQLEADIKELQNQCPKGTFYHSMIDFRISHVSFRRSMARFDNTPKVLPEEVTAAYKALGLPKDCSEDDLDDRIYRLRQRYDLQALRARNAPKDVIETAEKRLSEAEYGYKVLKYIV